MFPFHQRHAIDGKNYLRMKKKLYPTRHKFLIDILMQFVHVAVTYKYHKLEYWLDIPTLKTILQPSDISHSVVSVTIVP